MCSAATAKAGSCLVYAYLDGEQITGYPKLLHVLPGVSAADRYWHDIRIMTGTLLPHHTTYTSLHSCMLVSPC